MLNCNQFNTAMDDRGASHHQYAPPGGLRRAVAQRKGIVAEGAEAKGFPGQIHEQLSDCRICEVLCGVLSQFGESSLCCAEAYGGGAFLRNFDSRC